MELPKHYQSNYSPLKNVMVKIFRRLRNESPEYFANVSLYLEVLRLLSIYPYRMVIRRFVQELFDKVQFTKENIAKIDEKNGLIPQQKIDKEVDGLNFGIKLDVDSHKGKVGSSPAVKINRIELKPSRVVRGF